MLDRYFESARSQPSLMSGDEARDLLARPVDESGRDPGSSGPGRRGKIAAGGSLIAGCLLLIGLLVYQPQRDLEPVTAGEPTAAAAESGEDAGRGMEPDVTPVPPSAARSHTPPVPRLTPRRSSGTGAPVITPPSSPAAVSDPDEVSPDDPEYLLPALVEADAPDALPKAEPQNADPVLTTATWYRTTASLTTEEVTRREGVRITPITSLNSAASYEYNPLASPDGSTLYFTSTSSVDGLGGHDIWVADRREGSDEFGPPVNIGSRLNSSQDEGGVTLVGDGRTMYFTSCERSDGLGNCDLYEARLTESGWEEVRNVQELNSRHWESHPSVSADGTTIYFVSNRPGSVGGGDDADIWVAHRQGDGSWSRPENLGRSINSKDLEDSPFITPAGDALYFSSKGHRGAGDFDFFVVERMPDGTWGEPQNLGREINTRESERFLSLSPGEDLIYFARQDGGRDYNLYTAERKPRSKSAIISGTVRSTERNDYIRADLLFVDRTTGRILGQRRTEGEDGRFSILLDPGMLRSGGTIDLYGLADTLGEFRGVLELPSRDSWSAYRIDLRVIDTSHSSMATPSGTDGAGQIDRGITMALHQEMLLVQGNGIPPGPLTIIDSHGREVLRREITPEQTGPERSIALDISVLPEGLYLVRTDGPSGLFRRPAIR